MFFYYLENVLCCRVVEGVDVAMEAQKPGDMDRAVSGRGLVASDAWADSTPAAKKVQRTDSQKKEKKQRTLSLKTNKKMTVGAESPPPLADMEGMLERKHLHQSGGKMATMRSWKHYYTVLAGQLLCFFKDHHGSYFSQLCDWLAAWFSG